MPERRYSEEEVAAIFRAATEAFEPGDSTDTQVPATGLTLAQVQAIGHEAGIQPEAIARAAQAVDLPPTRARRLLGFPLSVSHTVPLHRHLSDAEWDRLVVQLREVFKARGRVRSEGTLRVWTDGNIDVLLEPIEEGHQLRFTAVHGAAQAGTILGLGFLGVAVVTTAATLLSGGWTHAATGIAILALTGIGLIATSASRLPGWARTRSAQMMSIGARVALPPSAATLRSAPTEPGSATD